MKTCGNNPGERYKGLIVHLGVMVAVLSLLNTKFYLVVQCMACKC